MTHRTPQAIKVPGHGDTLLHVWYHDGDGPPLLLTHCTGTHARVWDPVIAALDGAFRVYAVDTRGHGRSGQPQEREAYTWPHSGADLLAVIDAIGLPPGLRAAGHSAGGAHLAYAEARRPGTFGRVALFDPIIGPRQVFDRPNPLAESARRRRNTFETLEDARTRYRAKPPMRAWDEAAFEAYLAHAFRPHPGAGIELRLPGPIEAWCYEHGGACDLYETPEALAFDALVVSGADSNVLPLAEHLATRLPTARLEVLPGTGHFIPQERPAESARVIRDWLA